MQPPWAPRHAVTGCSYAVWVSIPIACSLGETAARAQLDEWRAAFAAAIAATDRVAPAELALRLRDDLSGVTGLVRLAQRERACCPFFEFALQIEPDAVTLKVRVPADAVPVLDQFAQLMG